MEIEIDLIDETAKMTSKDIDFVKQLLLFAASKEIKDEDRCEMSVTFVSNEEIRVINKEYRGIDEPTDVISFALEELDEEEIAITGADLPRFLGDIVISVEKADEQAHEYGHSFQRELGFLAVHGFLHLLGYDHMTQDEEKEMFTRQEDILKSYGLER